MIIRFVTQLYLPITVQFQEGFLMSITLQNQRFVAHIDILGMSALVAKDAELAWQLLSALVEARKEAHYIKIRDINAAEDTELLTQIHAVTFSDTVVLFTKNAQPADLKAILIMATEVLNKALRLCVPIRIGISVGTFFFNLDESMYAGPALIEAYRLGEEAQWIGITTSKEVYRRSIEAKLFSGDSDSIIPTDIPHRDGYKLGYALNWPTILRNSIAAPLPVTAEQVYEGFAQYFGDWDSLQPDAKLKYENTAKFMNVFGDRLTHSKNSA